MNLNVLLYSPEKQKKIKNTLHLLNKFNTVSMTRFQSHLKQNSQSFCSFLSRVEITF